MIPGYVVEAIVEKSPDGSEIWVARVQSMPGCLAQAATLDAAKEALATLFPSYVTARRARGVDVAPPDLPGGTSCVWWAQTEGGAQP